MMLGFGALKRFGIIKVITIKGGLGNQMFQYAFYLAHKKQHPFSIYLFTLEGDARFGHFGYQMDEIFNTRTLKRDKIYCFLTNHLSWIIRYSTRVVEKQCFQYNNSYFLSPNIVSIYDGYWQSEKYFSFVADMVRKRFVFPFDSINNETKRLHSVVQNKESVSIHVRRGDYLALTDTLGMCDLSYYHRSIDYMKNRLSNPLFVFFSDDIAWVKENLPIDDAVYVSWNHGKESWQDMYLMSQCQHNIIANSTFSWWGAWLNANPQKIVISPKRWFLFSPNHDLLPQEWVTL